MKPPLDTSKRLTPAELRLLEGVAKRLLGIDTEVHRLLPRLIQEVRERREEEAQELLEQSEIAVRDRQLRGVG